MWHHTSDMWRHTCVYTHRQDRCDVTYFYIYITHICSRHIHSWMYKWYVTYTFLNVSVTYLMYIQECVCLHIHPGMYMSHIWCTFRNVYVYIYIQECICRITSVYGFLNYTTSGPCTGVVEVAEHHLRPMYRNVCHISYTFGYGVAALSRLLTMTGLFCKRALWKRRYSAKETCNLKEPTHRSHPIPQLQVTCLISSDSSTTPPP